MATVHNGEPKKLVRSKEWLENRLEYLKGKRKSLKYDFETRSENVEQEIKDRTAELKELSSPKKAK